MADAFDYLGDAVTTDKGNIADYAPSGTVSPWDAAGVAVLLALAVALGIYARRVIAARSSLADSDHGGNSGHDGGAS